MKVKKRLIPVFSVIVLLGLCMSAVAYAHWQELLYFDGEINTGDFSAEITYYFPTTDDLDWTITEWDPQTYEAELNAWELITDKNIAIAYLEMNSPTSVNMHIENAYPAFLAGFDMWMFNTGTIPWRLWKGEFLPSGETFQGTFEWIPLNLDADADIEAYLIIDSRSSFGYQIDPGYWIDMSWKIYFTNYVEEGECFDITIKLHYLNWNEWIEFDPTYGTKLYPGDLVPPL